jgi:hypothetical protein
MEMDFCTNLLRLVPSTHLENLRLKAIEDERYEHATVVRDEIEARVTKGFMRYVGEGEERIAVPVEVIVP